MSASQMILQFERGIRINIAILVDQVRRPASMSIWSSEDSETLPEMLSSIFACLFGAEELANLVIIAISIVICQDCNSRQWRKCRG